ncbi:unnamed protein product [Danaus chrysippus]|uniref:(African queen) hypothetical protein n=1 Tax=Danaus chrysippus TaxID=151541 RepID=A0A8J2QGD3_9NEOP|nr:unnamed protein product [Danaus chrysippus]
MITYIAISLNRRQNKADGATSTTFIKHSTLCRGNLVARSPVWKPREASGEAGAAVGLSAAAPAPAPTTLPRSQRPVPRAPHLSASRKSLAPDHRH